MTTRDGVSAQLTAPRSESFPADDLGAAPVERVATEPAAAPRCSAGSAPPPPDDS